MMNKKAVKNFFRLEWRKLVFPAVFMALFLYTLGFFYTVGSVGDRYSCEHTRLLAEVNEAYVMNDTKAVNETLRRLWVVEDRFSEELMKTLHNRKVNAPVLVTTSLLGPLLPVPRLLQGYWDYPKPYWDYISSETYGCMITEVDGIRNTCGGLYVDGSLHIPSRCRHTDCSFSETVYHLEEIVYNPPSIPMISANIILLFLEGYLISCIILCIYRRFGSKE